MSISGLIMISAKEGRKHTSFLRWPGASKEEFILGMSGQSIIPTQVMIEEVNLKGNNTVPSHQGHNKAPLGHHPKRQRGQKLRRKIRGSAQKTILLILR
jgi:hypothetical protein